MDDLPECLTIGGHPFSRIDSDESIACWVATVDVEGVGESRPVSLVVEPAGAPEPEQLELAALVSGRFGEFVELAAAYLGRRLREPQFGLGHSELAKLDAVDAVLGAPEAAIWSDGTWMLRFAESSLEMADPLGIGVLFNGEVPEEVEDLSGAEPV